MQVRLQQSLAAGPEQLSLYEQAALQCDAKVAAMSEEERRTALTALLQQQVSPALSIGHGCQDSTHTHSIERAALDAMLRQQVCAGVDVSTSSMRSQLLPCMLDWKDFPASFDSSQGQIWQNRQQSS